MLPNFRATALALGAALLATASVFATTNADAQRIPTETATFAGGCYWCTESDFDKIDGVVSTTPGFMGGKTEKPTYKAVTYGNTGHKEVVRIEFDPKKVSYAQLVEVFWRTVDPLDDGGQFCDRGDSYRTGIFAHTPEQKAIAEASKKQLTDSARFKQPIVTPIIDASIFTPSDRAEDFDFYKKSPGHYVSYRAGCGRDARLRTLWGAEAGGKSAAAQ
jgi:peptide-methionine (S)-S-oxide reductase